MRDYSHATGTTHGTIRLPVITPLGSTSVKVYEREGKSSGETLKAEVTRNEANGVVTIKASGNEANPLVPGAPGITYDFNVNLDSEGAKGNLTVTVSGSHDGFPGYEILVVRPEAENKEPTLVYSHDPRKEVNGNTEYTPLALISDPENIESQRTVIRPKKK